MRAPIIYDRQLRPLAVLSGAFEIGYSLELNDLWTCSFGLAWEDPNQGACDMGNYVRLWDGERDLGLYRLNGMPSGNQEPGGVCVYTGEHVLATLLDDVVFGQVQYQGTFGEAVLDLLSRQSTARWVLDRCDFDSVPVNAACGNDTLLASLRILCEQLGEEYVWQWDTDSRPWRLQILRPDEQDGCGIHYARNLVGVEKTIDMTTLVTRLYLVGPGDAGAQMTISEINGGVPYIDADTIDRWGVRSAVYADADAQTPAQLLTLGRAQLEAYKQPHVSYVADALDLSELTGDPWDTFLPGKRVRVTDDEHGIRFSARIVTVSKDDVGGDPGGVTVTIANKERDAMAALSTLAGMAQQTESRTVINSARLRAYALETDALGQRVTEAESSITVTASGITLLSQRTTTIEGEVTATSAQLKVNNDSIATLVTRTDSIDGRVSGAESAIEQFADDIKLYVKKGDDISAMVELHGDGVDIVGKTITLDGSVIAERIATNLFTGRTITGVTSLTTVSASGDTCDFITGRFQSATVDGKALASHKLKIGSKECDFFAPGDATFDFADTDEYAAAVSAGWQSGRESVKILASDILAGDDAAYYSSTKEIYVTVTAEADNGESNSNRIGVDASRAYQDGADSVSITTSVLGPWYNTTSHFYSANVYVYKNGEQYGDPVIVSTGNQAWSAGFEDGYNRAIENAAFSVNGTKVVVTFDGNNAKEFDVSGYVAASCSLTGTPLPGHRVSVSATGYAYFNGTVAASKGASNSWTAPT